MESTIEKPKERIVTITMTQSEALTLGCIAPNIGYQQILNFGGAPMIATKGAKVFAEIARTLREIREVD